MDLDAWFGHARRDAAARGLPALEPLLEMLRHATRALRAADWARDAEWAEGSSGPEGAGDNPASPTAPDRGQ